MIDRLSGNILVNDFDIRRTTILTLGGAIV